MTTGEERLKSERLTALTSELKNLSGRYGDIQDNPDGYLVSNDEGYAEVCSTVRERLATKHGGIGVFVGSGGLLSSLPDLPVDVVVMLDLDPSVLRFSETLARLIAESDTSKTVLDRLNSDELPVRYQVASRLRDEADEYREFHWTNPTRFPLVQEAMKRKPIIYIATDIANEGFGSAFSSVVGTFNERIPFANFTNVHAYIKPRTMDFIQDWGFEDDATILYSSKKNVELGHFPKIVLATSPQEYIQRAKVDNS